MQTRICVPQPAKLWRYEQETIRSHSQALALWHANDLSVGIGWSVSRTWCCKCKSKIQISSWLGCSLQYLHHQIRASLSCSYWLNRNSYGCQDKPCSTLNNVQCSMRTHVVHNWTAKQLNPADLGNPRNAYHIPEKCWSKDKFDIFLQDPEAYYKEKAKRERHNQWDKGLSAQIRCFSHQEYRKVIVKDKASKVQWINHHNCMLKVNTFMLRQKQCCRCSLWLCQRVKCFENTVIHMFNKNQCYHNFWVNT